MLRTFVLLLLLANAGFFAWQQGWLDGPLGGASARQQGREPQRLTQQVNPERLIVLAPETTSTSDDATHGAASNAAGVEAGASAATGAASIAALTSPTGSEGTCREAGPFTPDEFKQASTLVNQRLPAGSWAAQTVTVQGLWLVYMGPYPDLDTYQRKQTELRRIKGLTFEEVRSPAKLAMGLSLGRFSNEEQALSALETMKLRGVRTAYVVSVRPTMDFSVIRVAQANAQLQRLLPSLPLPAGKGFAPCPP